VIIRKTENSQHKAGTLRVKEMLFFMRRIGFEEQKRREGMGRIGLAGEGTVARV
jgi:hypothetical protein